MGAQENISQLNDRYDDILTLLQKSPSFSKINL